MKRIIVILLVLIFSMELFAQLGYCCQGKFIQLTPSITNQYYVQTRNAESKVYLQRIAKTESLLKINIRNVYAISENSFYVSSKSNLMQTDYVSEQFHDSKGNPYYILPKIILALKDNAHINDVIKGFSGILALDSIQRLKEMITLTCNLSSAQEVLNVVAKLNINNEVKWCEPDMICKWETHEYNPLLSMQYYLQNNNSGQYDINVVPAWGVITGSGNITVAVIDDGVDPNHEDLSGNVLQGYTIGDAIGYGQPKNENDFNCKGHGIACAGIIGAKNNDKGILGVAYGVKILPINVYPGWAEGYYYHGKMYISYSGFANSNSDLAYAIQWAAERADILSISWGGSSDIGVLITVINSAMSNGRNGKGCVVVASSGNDYPTETSIKFPARINGVIAVGAINKNGVVQNYSQRGSELDLVAPSGLCELQGDIVTTDRMDTLGYNPYGSIGTELANTNYTQRFGGTSASCPQVAGVVALMLSANPNLTVENVRGILHATARKLPGMNGANWTDAYGYGLVDACAAVLKAYLNLSGSYHVCSTETYTIQNLPIGSTVQWSASNSKLSLVSGQGTGTATFQKVSNGACTITAQVTLGTTTVSFTKDVWAGVPTAPSISGWPNTNQFLPSRSYILDAIGNTDAQILEYQWDVVRGATITSGGNSSTATFMLNPSGSVKIGVRARNACGWSSYNYKIGGISNDAPINSPGNNILTIPLSDDGEYEIQLWNTNRMIRSTKTTKSSYDVDLNNLPSDVYIIKVIKDGCSFIQLKVKNK